MTRDEKTCELEQALKDRYPDAQVAVTGQGDGVTIAVNQPDDSIRLSIDADRIQGGSAVLARILSRRAHLPPFQRTDPRNPEMAAFDPRKPNIARIYDALRDGKDNFAPDREAADAIREMAADGQRAAHDNRAFLARAVRFLIRKEGVYQFLDIGSGMPADRNTHEVAHALSLRAHTAYIDNGPVVIGHAKARLEGKFNSIALPGDLRTPHEFLHDPALRGFIDFTRPVAVLLLAVLHFIESPLALQAVQTVMRETAPGSCLVISHATAGQATPGEIKTVTEIYDRAGTPIFLRTKDEIAAFFDGLELTAPGVTEQIIRRSRLLLAL